ncbi:hypothetical protein [Actinacidiphila oryziradicis]|uniref:Uncharacterized protein n=1 Tax=Actinacidiphila oryziradicis TaxID=2571141 RepID=A0A4U0SMU0_9ACTN|nr:hypothetical protein FCI23_13090 [Actinacidiphila oryziradicis]
MPARPATRSESALPICPAPSRPQEVSRAPEPPGPKLWVPLMSMARRLAESPVTEAWKAREEVSAPVIA